MINSKLNNYLNKSCYELFKESCNTYDNKTAFIYLNNKIKYNTLLNKVEECALSFKKIGVTNKNIVSIISSNSIEIIIIFYALNKLGVCVNMINPLTKDNEIKNIINKTNSKYLIISDTIYDKISSIKNELKINKIIYLKLIETLDSISKLKYIFKNKININSNDEISFYRFMLKGKYSKETIKSKKSDECLIINKNLKNIVLSNKNINSYATSLYNKKIYRDKIILSNYSLTDSYGISLIHSSIINGSTYIISDKLIDSIIKYKPNIIECNTNTFNTLIVNRKLNKKDLSFIDYVICSKEELHSSLKEKINKFLTNHNSNAKIINCYGMSECTANISFSENNYLECIDSTNIRIFETDSFKECKSGVLGEICISGSTVMNGYFNETNTLKKHNGNLWFRTGDLGYIDSNNNIVFKSSIKRVIISDGNKIYPSEIEEIILKHPYVKSCLIVGFPHPYKKEVVKCYIVLKDNLVLNSSIKKSIKEYVEENIPSYALPYSYGYRDEIPKTIDGKVEYNELIKTKEEN